MSDEDNRILRIKFAQAEGVDVTGYLQFTKSELEDMARALYLTASKRPADYKPLFYLETEPKDTKR